MEKFRLEARVAYKVYLEGNQKGWISDFDKLTKLNPVYYYTGEMTLKHPYSSVFGIVNSNRKSDLTREGLPRSKRKNREPIMVNNILFLLLIYYYIHFLTIIF